MEQREILFRGMTLMEQWKYGNYSRIDKKTSIHEAGSYISNSVGIPLAFMIRPETRGQFTGLWDHKSIKIFEGDIMNGETDSELGFVVFQDGRFIVNRPWGPINLLEYLENNKTRVVIGNIHGKSAGL